MPRIPKCYTKVCETCMEEFQTRFNRDTECSECKKFPTNYIEMPWEVECIKCRKPFISVKTICYTDLREPPIVTYGRRTCSNCRKWLLELQDLHTLEELEVESNSFGYRG